MLVLQRELKVMKMCPFCYQKTNFVEAHGSQMCPICGAKVVGCCGDGGCII